MADTGLDIKDVVVMKTGRIPAESNEGVWSHMGHASEPGPVASPCNPSSPACSSPEPLVTPEEALLGAGLFFCLFKDFLKILFWIWAVLKVFMNLLQYCLCFLFCFSGRKACGIFVP